VSRGPRRPTLSGVSRPVFAGLVGAIATLVVLSCLSAALGVWLFSAPGPRARQGASTTVILRHGAGLGEIGADLQAAGVVRSAPLFMAAAQLTGTARRIRAGEYAFPSRASLRAVLHRLRLGLIVHHRITIPEGLSSRQAVEVLERSDVLVGAVDQPPEGSLLPNTYEVVRGQTRASVLKRMTQDRDRLLAVLWAARRAGLPFTDPNQAVTLASIVEKETALAAERPHVASVYINRLRAGIKLEADPTVIYGITHGAGSLGHGLRASELAQATPYNTYLNVGLPPTPIDNPGRASLAAVLDPAETHDLYFVADGSGGHAFSDTLAEHQKNVARWRAFEKAQAEHEALSGAPLPPASRPPGASKPFTPIEHR
jgi:UPF0755 protein